MRKRPGGCYLPLIVFTLALPTLLVTCSTVTHYPVETQDLLGHFQTGSSDLALAEAQKHWKKGLDRLAYLLEGAMILYTRGNPAESNAVFEEAERLIQRHEEKARLSLSEGTAELGSLVLNEKTLPYAGEPFEKVLVNTYKAANYLFLHDYEGARVEIRRSFARQQENRRNQRKEYERFEEEAGRMGLSSRSIVQEVEAHHRDRHPIARGPANLYEDAFAYYLSAVVYELNREYNDAYIDLKRVHELRPGVPYVEDDLLRMALLSGLSDRLKDWMERFGRPPRLLDETRAGEVFLFFGCGMAPRKREMQMSIAIPDVGIVSLAFPKYEPVSNSVSYAALYDEQGRSCGRTFVLTDLQAIAIRSLEDRMPTLVLKQVLRATLKGAMVKTAGDEGGWAGEMIANLFNVVTEQADLRSWQTLPRNIQVARIPLPEGTHELTLVLHGSGGDKVQERSISLDVRPGEKIFLNARSGPWDLVGLNVFQLGPTAVNRVE